MGIPLLQFLQPVGVRRAARPKGAREPSYARPIHSKSACKGKSQPPDVADERVASGKMQIGRKLREALLLDRARADQHAETAGIVRAFHVECGVADIPRLGRADAAAVEREQHRRGMRLVERGITGADESLEMARPTEVIRLAPQDVAGLVADDAE